MPKYKRHSYTDEQYRFIKSRYLHTFDKVLVIEFNEKFNTNINSECLRRYRNRHGMVKTNATRYEMEGYVNPCKGRKLGFIPKTAFKKGIKHGDYQTVHPIGTIIRHKGDHAYKIKIAWPNVWEYVHLNEWRCYGRVIPENHAIIYKDGNKENWSIDNIDCVHVGVVAVMCRHLGHVEDYKTKRLMAELMIASNEAMRECGLDPQAVRRKIRLGQL